MAVYRAVKDENGNVTGEKPGEKTISVQVP